MTAADSAMEAIVVGIGCGRCRRLTRMTREALAQLGRDNVVVRTADDLDEIVGFGPLLTPALIFGGALLVSGRLPSQRHLTRLIQGELQRQV